MFAAMLKIICYCNKSVDVRVARQILRLQLLQSAPGFSPGLSSMVPNAALFFSLFPLFLFFSFSLFKVSLSPFLFLSPPPPPLSNNTIDKRGAVRRDQAVKKWFSLSHSFFPVGFPSESLSRFRSISGAFSLLSLCLSPSPLSESLFLSRRTAL